VILKADQNRLLQLPNTVAQCVLYYYHYSKTLFVFFVMVMFSIKVKVWTLAIAPLT